MLSRPPAPVAEEENWGTTPLDFLIWCSRDKTLDRSLRIQAAKAAAPYIHPQLSRIEGRLGLVVAGVGGTESAPAPLQVEQAVKVGLDVASLGLDALRALAAIQADAGGHSGGEG